MALKFPPAIGLVVICNYDTGFKPPEMVKRRLAVVVSERLPYRDGLCTVVPLSTTPSRSGIRYQCKVELPVDLPDTFSGAVKWAKADMLATLSYERMSLPFDGRSGTGRRRYLQIRLPPAELRKIQSAMLHALSLEHLTKGG
ncbi:type II toxin-antitoxin system PemK/MazF family toxin [Pseudohoeflea suaedae]|nr:type II toxin-antitoxin system PemK/MazF family toxin [Pseudohoeflea suaedae]